MNNDIKWKGKGKKGENDFAHMRWSKEWRRLEKQRCLLAIDSITEFDFLGNMKLNASSFFFFWLLTLLLDTHHKERRLLSLFITIHQSWHCCGFHIHKGLGFLSFPPMRIYIEGWRVSARNSPLSEVQLTGLWTNFRTDKGKGRERGKCGRLKANNEGN